MAKIKNIIIFVAIGVALVLVYIFFLKPTGEEASLVSSTTAAPGSENMVTNTLGETSVSADEFLTLLLNVKNIGLDISIFSDVAFNSLHDSSVILNPDGNEGRPNPFAQFGNDAITASVSPVVTTTPSTQLVPGTVSPEPTTTEAIPVLP